MNKTFVVSVVDTVIKQHVLTTFCESLEETRQQLAEMEKKYPGNSYRLMVSPSLEDAEYAEQKILEGVYREAWIQSRLMGGRTA